MLESGQSKTFYTDFFVSYNSSVLYFCDFPPIFLGGSYAMVLREREFFYSSQDVIDTYLSIEIVYAQSSEVSTKPHLVH